MSAEATEVEATVAEANPGHCETVGPDDARRILAMDRERRVKACASDIDGALARHGCVMAAVVRPVEGANPGEIVVQARPIVRALDPET